MITEEDIIKNWKTDRCKVSVCCLSFNQEAYVAQCIDSILGQLTTFPFEILIHDDASSDHTAEIIARYQERYPRIIKAIFQKENQRSRIGSGMNPTFNFPRAKGEYIAFCECDDFWTDSDKLNKQISFLEEHKEFGGVVTDYSKMHERDESIDEGVLKSQFGIQDSEEIPSNNIFKRQLKKTRTVTALLRKSVLDEFAGIPFIKGVPGDTQMFTYIICKSKLYLLADQTSMYRIRRESVSHTASFDKKQSFYKSFINYMEFAVERYQMSNSDISYLHKSKNLYRLRQLSEDRRPFSICALGMKMIFIGQASRIIFKELKRSLRTK